MSDDRASISDHRRHRPRSPSYPSIPLDVAISRARVLYEHEGRHAAPIAQIAQHWGYSPKSSGGTSTIAALKKFGLLVDEGNAARRHAELTPLALTILIDERNRDQAIRDAALMPPIHRELWQKYGPLLPSDGTIRSYLLLERDFTENGVKEFIPVFRRTVDFAQLGMGDDGTSSDLDGEQEETDQAAPDQRDLTGIPVLAHLSAHHATSPTRTIQLPLSPGKWVAVQGDFPLSQAEWRQMLAVLGAMQPALTVEPRSADDQPTGDPGRPAD
jgi:hypothetical protein